MGMVILPPGVTWQQYNNWLQNSPQGQQYAQYINQAGAGIPTGVSHSPPMGGQWPTGQQPPAPQQAGAAAGWPAPPSPQVLPQGEGGGSAERGGGSAEQGGASRDQWGAGPAPQQSRPLRQSLPQMFRPGAARAIPPRSQGTAYGQPAPWSSPKGIGGQKG